MEILHNAAAQVTMFCIFIENSGAVALLFFFDTFLIRFYKIGKMKTPETLRLSRFRELFKRCLADSNCCRRFCRPLTKPLIQGTINSLLLNAAAKVMILF